jgi:hypothetical protein
MCTAYLMRYILLALSQISTRRFGADIAAPLWTAQYLDVPPRVALALGLRPDKWPLVLWRTEEECAAPGWPSVDVAVALLASADRCKKIRFNEAAVARDGGMYEVRAAAQLDGIELEAVPNSPKFRLMTAGEILDEVYGWMGDKFQELQYLPPKRVVEDPQLAAVVALGAMKLVSGIYVPEPQVLTLFSALARR